MLIAAGSNRVRRVASCGLAVGAVGAVALLATGIPSESYWLVVAAPVALYALYAVGLRGWLPRRVGKTQDRVPDAGARPTAREVDWLLLVRGLACALVYVMHTGIIFRRDFSGGGNRWAWVIFSPAWLGMMLFFSLSGYLMGKGFYTGKYRLTESSVWKYLRNRFLRIVPLMVVVAFFAILWQSPELIAHPQVWLRMSLFGFSTGSGATTLGAYWSLSTEWQFYLLVPVFFAVAVRALGLHRPTPATRLVVATLLVLGAGTYVRYYQWSHHGASAAAWGPYIYPNLFCNLDVFLLGFLVNWWLPRVRRFASVLARAWPLMLVAIYLPYAYVSFRGLWLLDPNWLKGFAIFSPGLTALCVMPVLVGCEQLNVRERTRAKPRRKTATVLFWVGALTYPVYLIHGPLLFGLSKGLPFLPIGTKSLIGIVVVLFAAWVLHMTVEESVLSYRKRLGDRSRRSAKPELEDARAM